MDREKLHRLLRLGLEKGASDIHFQVGYLPLYRFHGELVELRYKVLTPKDTEEIAKHLLEQDETSTESGLQRARPRLRAARRGPLPGQHLAPAALLQHRPARHPAADQGLRGSQPARRPRRHRPASPGLRARHRRHRHGQVHHPRDDDQRGQPQPEGEDRDRRGSDRVRLHPRQEHHHPARDRHRHRVLPGRAARRPAPGSGRHHGRRDARPRDRRHLAQGGRDRPPGLLDDPHRATSPRRSTASSPSSRSRSSSRCGPGWRTTSRRSCRCACW